MQRVSLGPLLPELTRFGCQSNLWKVVWPTVMHHRSDSTTQIR